MKNQIFPLLAFLNIMLSACNDSEILSRVDKVDYLSISVQNKTQSRTLIEEEYLPDGHSIGVTVSEPGKTTYDGKLINNRQYTSSGIGSNQSWDSTDKILVGSTVGEAYAYYPFSAGITDITNISINAEHQTDWMYSKIGGISNSSPNASFTMNHALSVIRLSISKGSYTGTGKISSLSIQGAEIGITGTLNAKTGTLSNITKNIPLMQNENVVVSNSAIFKKDFIVIPTSSKAPITISTIIDGKRFNLNTAEISLNPGYLYDYQLKINNSGLTLQNVSVGDWGYNNKGEIEVDCGYKVIIKETKDIAVDLSVSSGNLKIIATSTCANPLKEAVISGSATLTQHINGISNEMLISDISSDIVVTLGLMPSSTPIDINKVADGVYYYGWDNIITNEPNTMCKGVVLKSQGECFMIEKNECKNRSYRGKNGFKWGGFGFDQSEINNYPTLDGTNRYGSLGREISDKLSSWTDGALSDKNGKSHSAQLLHINDSGIGQLLKDFIFSPTDNQGFSDWYMPEARKMALICLNFNDINSALEKIGGDFLDSYGYYATSSEIDNNKFWMCTIDRGFFEMTSKENILRVRFVRDIPEYKTFVDIATAADGVYFMDSDNKIICDALPSCKGIILKSQGECFMIEKNGRKNSSFGDRSKFSWGRGYPTSMNVFRTLNGTDSDGGFPNQNGIYVNERYSSISGNVSDWTKGALTDTKGKESSAEAMEMGCEIGSCLKRFNSTKADNQGFSDWYIPTIRQVAIIYMNSIRVNNGLREMQAEEISFYEGLWSSTWQDISYPYLMDPDYLFGPAPCSFQFGVRFVRDIK